MLTSPTQQPGSKTPAQLTTSEFNPGAHSRPAAFACLPACHATHSAMSPCLLHAV
jgi:hypothetical protein